jgi:hypothetical protein
MSKAPLMGLNKLDLDRTIAKAALVKRTHQLHSLCLTTMVANERVARQLANYPKAIAPSRSEEEGNLITK